VVRNLAAFASRYNTNGVHIAGEYAGKLANGGDNVRLEFYRHKLFDILYNDARGWPSAADGGGHSLIPLNASVEEQGFDILDYGGNWRASTYVGGSPGEADPVPAAGMVINEVIAHTDTGMAPPYDSNDKIELYNPTSEPITLDGFWFLSDNATNPEKYRIPSGLMIPSGGWVVFDEDDFHSDRTNGFGLDKAGEQVVFSHRPGSGLSRVVDCIDFKGQANGASWGRYPDGNAFFQSLDPTAGAANQLSAAGILIGELMYNPLTVTGINADEVLEYILLTNVSASTISFDGGPGLSNTWRLNGGVGYNFDPGTFMTAGEHLWVVPFDPVAEPGSRALFCSTYGLNAGTARLLGPYSGDLSDIGERFTLERPQASDDPLTPGDISWIIVDEVTWVDEAPWPEEADGTGRPLVRVGLSGNDPASWSTSYDSDNDGLPDIWEQAYRIALTDLGAGDFDLDGFLDVSEYVAGSNPDDPGSLLKFMRMEIEGTEMVLSWQAVAGKTYAVWIKTNLSDSVWSLHEVGIPGVEPTSSTTVQTDNTTGFIRIEVEQ